MAQYVDSIVNLKKTLPTNLHPVGIVLTGYYQKNDMPYVNYLWDLNSVELDNGGSIIAVDGVDKGRWKARLSLDLNVRHFGAKGDGIKNDSPSFQNALDFLNQIGGGVLHVPSGQFLLKDPIRLYKKVSIAGLLPDVSILHIGLDSTTVPCIQIDTEISVTQGTFSVDNLSFIDVREVAKKSIAPAINLSGLLNAVVKNCQFRDLGGGAIRISKSSNTTIQNIYAFGCGKRFKKGKINKAELGIIHMDRETGFSNTLNLSNTYISNCSNAIGLYIASHAVRINNCTIESCETLLRLGSMDHVSRNLIITGLYLENARSYGIEMINLIGATIQNLYYRDSNVSKQMKKSVRIDNCHNVQWENANLGEFGFQISRGTSNITFESCTGVFPENGISGVNDSNLITNLNTRHGAFGLSNNWLPSSNSFNEWSGDAKVKSNFSSELGLQETTLSKTSKGSSIYKKVKGPFAKNTNIVFSVFVKGACSLRMRSPSDLGGYTDLILRAFKDANTWHRIYVVGKISQQSAANIMVYITPKNFGTANAQCLISNAQIEVNKSEPGPYLDTSLPVTNNTVATINGLFTVGGKVRGTATSPPITGLWNQGDQLDNSKPEVGAALGWVCIKSGSPGDWIPTGML